MTNVTGDKQAAVVRAIANVGANIVKNAALMAMHDYRMTLLAGADRCRYPHMVRKIIKEADQAQIDFNRNTEWVDLIGDGPAPEFPVVVPIEKAREALQVLERIRGCGSDDQYQRGLFAGIDLAMEKVFGISRENIEEVKL